MPVDVAGFVSVLIPKALAASVAAQSVDMQQHLGSPRQDSADCEDSPPEPGRTVTVQMCYDDAVAAIVAANVAAVEEAVVVTTTKKRPAPTTRAVAQASSNQSLASRFKNQKKSARLACGRKDPRFQAPKAEPKRDHHKVVIDREQIFARPPIDMATCKVANFKDEWADRRSAIKWTWKTMGSPAEAEWDTPLAAAGAAAPVSARPRAAQWFWLDVPGAGLATMVFRTDHLVR